MKHFKNTTTVLLLISILFISCDTTKKEEQKANQITEIDTLPSWNEGATKTSILNDVTNAESNSFIPIKDRIATFDNDGWTVIDMKNDWKVIFPFELK